MGGRVEKDALYQAFAEVAKALANGRRVELVDVLAQGERHVEELASEIDQSVANTSFHLRALAAAGLVTTRREGTRVYYRLASTRVGELWVAVRDVAAAHRIELDELAAAYLGDRHGLQQITRSELAERLESADVVLVDVRPVPEFEAGHIAGAVSIPFEDLPDRIAELPADLDVVAYCRGPYCVFADDTVRLLTGRGRRALRLEDGYPEWRTAGLPTDGRSAKPVDSGAGGEGSGDLGQ